jgi:hypothetical protein
MEGLSAEIAPGRKCRVMLPRTFQIAGLGRRLLTAP